MGKFSSLLSKKLKSKGVEVRNWVTRVENISSLANIDKILKINPILEVTNYGFPDGLKNIYGPAVVNICKANLIPVGKYSKHVDNDFIENPNLFDIIIPYKSDNLATYIAHIYDGFKMIQEHLNLNPQISDYEMNLPKIMTNIVRRDNMYNDFFWYTKNITDNNLAKYMTENSNFSGKSKKTLIKYILVYVIGHIFLNSVLKYPGPILSEDALCSYLSIKKPAPDALQKLFSGAKYKGPFCKLNRFYWRRDVDIIMYSKGKNLNRNYPREGAFNRAVLENSGISTVAFQMRQM